MSSRSKRKNSHLDQFYTKENVAIDLIKILESEVGSLDQYRVIEPSAGSGSFSRNIKNCEAYDIDPKHESIIKADFFNIGFVTFPENVVVVGNPPFGRQSSLAFKFIKKSMLIADTVAFILPASFGKISYKNRIPLTHSLIRTEVLPKNSFTVDGSDFDVNAIFQIWRKRNRKKIDVKTKSQYFEFVDKENADIAVRRVGVNAGNVFKNVGDCSKQSHYFIKSSSPLLDIFERLSYTDKYGTGPNSISKHELIKAFEDYVQTRRLCSS